MKNEKHILGKGVDPTPTTLEGVKHKANIITTILIIVGLLFIVAAILCFIFIK